MFHLGTPELVIILLIVVVLFGGSRLPALGKGMGQALRSFKKGITGSGEEETENDEKKTENELEAKAKEAA